MTIMCEEGNIVEYLIAYLEIWRPWAPVHVMRRIRDGSGASSVGVEVCVEGTRSHIVGAMSSNPDIALCGILDSTIATMFESVRIQHKKSVCESNRPNSKRKGR